MSILSRILITVAVLLGVAFAVMLSLSSCQNGPNIAGCGIFLYEFGCNGPVEPFPEDSGAVAAWLEQHGVSKQCYKIRFWKKDNTGWHHQSEKDIGSLAAIECFTIKGAQFPGPKMMAPSGSGGTQKVMFNTSAMREAFDKKIKRAKE